MTKLIRMATESDAESVRSIYAPFCGESSIVSFEVVPPSVDEIRGRIAKTLGLYPWLVVESDGTILGYAYAYTHNERAAYRWSVNAGIYVRQGHHGAGIGRALYTSLFGALGLQGFINVYGGISLPNPASVGLHRAFGFDEVGIYRGVGFKAGAWRDVAWWQVALRDRPDDPAPPRTPAEVAGDPGWAEAIGSGLVHLRPSEG